VDVAEGIFDQVPALVEIRRVAVDDLGGDQVVSYSSLEFPLSPLSLPLTPSLYLFLYLVLREEE